MTKKHPARESLPELIDRIDSSFFGDHGRPKKHIHLSHETWVKLKHLAAQQQAEMDEETIRRLLTPSD